MGETTAWDVRFLGGPCCSPVGCFSALGDRYFSASGAQIFAYHVATGERGAIWPPVADAAPPGPLVHLGLDPANPFRLRAVYAGGRVEWRDATDGAVLRCWTLPLDLRAAAAPTADGPRRNLLWLSVRRRSPALQETEPDPPRSGAMAPRLRGRRGNGAADPSSSAEEGPEMTLEYAIVALDTAERASCTLLRESSLPLDVLEVHPAATNFPLLCFGGARAADGALELWNVAANRRAGVLRCRSRIIGARFHPLRPEVAVADAAGRLFVFPLPPAAYGGDEAGECLVLGEADARLLHWHAHAFRAMAFTVEGAHLLTGGAEGVVVVWQVDAGSRDFVPRLGAEVVALTTSRDGRLWAAVTDDNTVRFLDAYSRDVVAMVRGVKPIAARARRARSDTQWRSFGLALDPVHRRLVLPGRAGVVQIYNPATDRHVDELVVCAVNQGNRLAAQHSGPQVAVRFLQFTACGNYLVTVHKLRSGAASPGDRRALGSGGGGGGDEPLGAADPSVLKFWARSPGTDRFVEITRVERPHGRHDITALAAHPTRPVLCSVGGDGLLRLWSLQADVLLDEARGGGGARAAAAAAPSTSDPTTSSWFNLASHRVPGDAAPSDAAFSNDGSLVAVAAGRYVILWDPVAFRHVTTLSSTRAVEAVVFVPGTPNLATCGSGRLSMWDLRCAGLAWEMDGFRVRAWQVLQHDWLRAQLAVTDGRDVMLLDPAQPNPLRRWSLPAHAAAATPLVAMAAYGAARRAPHALVLLNAAGALYMLERQDFGSGGASLAAAASAKGGASEGGGANLLERLFVLDAITSMDPARALDAARELSGAATGAAGAGAGGYGFAGGLPGMADVPSHSIAAPMALVSAFLAAALQPARRGVCPDGDAELEGGDGDANMVEGSSSGGSSSAGSVLSGPSDRPEVHDGGDGETGVEAQLERLKLLSFRAEFDPTGFELNRGTYVL